LKELPTFFLHSGTKETPVYDRTPFRELALGNSKHRRRDAMAFSLNTLKKKPPPNILGTLLLQTKSFPQSRSKTVGKIKL